MMPEIPNVFKPPTSQPRKVDTSRLPEQYKAMRKRRRPPDRMMERMTTASDRAMNRHQSVLGTPTVDPDIKLYESLSQQDLAQMTKEYGLEAVGKYVMTMESRRMGGR